MVQLGSKGTQYLASFHDTDGTIVAELPLGQGLDLSWARQLSEVSKFSVVGSTHASFEIVENLRPWIHWVALWRGPDFVWQGPVQQLVVQRTRWVLQAADHSTYHWRTRLQQTKTHTDADPVQILAELWDQMTAWHQLTQHTGGAVTVPSATSFTFSTVAQERMSHQAVDDLVKLGAEYTVLAGKPVIMPSLRSPAIDFKTPQLRDCDFAEEMEVGLDGVRFFTDIRVQGQNGAETVTTSSVPGLRLQELVSLDNLSGSGNIATAAQQIAARRGKFRRTLAVPASATLSPLVDIGINALMPGMTLPVFTELAGGLHDVKRLEAVEVTVSAGTERVAITLGESPTQTGGQNE